MGPEMRRANRQRNMDPEMRRANRRRHNDILEEIWDGDVNCGRAPAEPAWPASTPPAITGAHVVRTPYRKMHWLFR